MRGVSANTRFSRSWAPAASARVYRGRDALLSRDVAVKTCTSDDERLRRRFLHEAKIAAGLQHPHIVTVHDFGFEGDMPYMVQEYLTGEDLTEKIARRNLSFKERARYLLHIAQGLAYAHDHNVVHRDIKPGNIRITDDGQLRILDFGIARLLGQTRPFTTDGVTLGTVGYMAPELLSDDEVDWRCDIFSYGVVAYELLAYSLPFQGDTFVRISYRLLNEEPARLGGGGAGLSSGPDSAGGALPAQAPGRAVHHLPRGGGGADPSAGRYRGTATGRAEQRQRAGDGRQRRSPDHTGSPCRGGYGCRPVVFRRAVFRRVRRPARCADGSGGRTPSTRDAAHGGNRGIGAGRRGGCFVAAQDEA